MAVGLLVRLKGAIGYVREVNRKPGEITHKTMVSFQSPFSGEPGLLTTSLAYAIAPLRNFALFPFASCMDHGWFSTRLLLGP